MKTPEEIEQLAQEVHYESQNQGLNADGCFNQYQGFIKGYTQCQEDMADKIKEAVNLLGKIVENTELFFGYEIANKNSNIRNAKIFINSLNKQD